MLRITYKTLNSARLPLEVSRGTETQRFKMARTFTKKLKKNLSGETFNATELSQTLKKVLEPHEINFEILKNKDPNVRGACRLHVVMNNQNKDQLDIGIAGYKIILTPNSDGMFDKFTILHEAGHLFDHICNPKINNFSIAKLLINEELEKKVSIIKNLFLNPSSLPLKMKNFKKDIIAKLAEIPDEYAIDALQSIRGSLKTEIRQYQFGLQCISFDKLLEELMLVNSLKLKRKLKFANKLLRERITAARKNIATALQSDDVQA